jgi:hypothetical protein
VGTRRSIACMEHVRVILVKDGDVEVEADMLEEGQDGV